MRASVAIIFSAALAGMAGAALAQEPIKIGVITDKVGGAKFYAEPVTHGIEYAAKVINEKGGVLGRKIQVIVEDDQNKPDVTAAKARKLVEDGVTVFMTNTGSPATQQAETVSLETKTVQYTPANAGDTLTTALDNPWFFQTGPLASLQLATLMSYTKEKAYKKVAIVRDNSSLAQSFGESFRSGLEKAGVVVAIEEVIPQGATSAVANLQKVRAEKVDAIFQAGITGPEMLQFFRAYAQLGMNEPVLGSFNLSIPAYLTMAKDLMNGVAFVDAFDPDRQEVKDFVAAYKAATNETPTSLEAYGYDGMRMVADAITRAGGTDKEKVRAAMQATMNFQTVIGAKGSSWGFRDGKRTGFDPNGAVVRIIENNQHGKVVHAGQ